jgi:hypothetical protein
MNIKAIETQYKGYRFRSRLEARWAVFFDALGVKWEYEKEGYDLGDYGWYLPDFWLPDADLWIEVKGQHPTDDEKLKLMCLEERTGHKGFFFMQVPDSPNSFDWYAMSGRDDGWTDGWSKAFPVDASAHLPMHLTFDNLDDPQVLCPVCKDEYVHFSEPTVTESDDYTAWEGRGDALRIPMWCEQGHTWTVRYGFHKGFTFCKVENALDHVSNPGLALALNCKPVLSEAFKLARSARFEHGERGRVKV